MEPSTAAGSSGSNPTDAEEIWNMKDVLSNEDKVLEEVAAVLGAGDDFNCSYSQGYVNRQALYACLTCIPDGDSDNSKLAGVCLACSYHCHDGHILVELYTKRNFRCDCGNKKFNGAACTLCPEKDNYNELNRYNQNFYGLYCTCSTPYPNPDDPIEDEMLQCILCEDWYHSRHLGVPVPASYAELICINCIRENDFLLYYDGLSITSITQGDTSENVNIEVESSEVDDQIKETTDEISSSGCKRPKIKSSDISAKFMEDEKWRKNLCTCTDCTKIYEEKNITYLLDLQDTVQVYEEKGKAKVKEYTAEKEKTFLNSIPRVPLMEMLAGYNDFKEQLMEYLRKFAENKKVIRVEDIHEFFSELKSRKKQKVEMPYYCR